MIKLIPGYMLGADEMNWILYNDKPVIDKKTGREQYRPLGYFNSLSGALMECRRKAVRGEMTKHDYDTMQDLLDAIRAIDASMAAVIRENIPKSEVENMRNA